MKLRSIEIHVGANGGHRIVHSFEPEMTSKRGAMSGGLYMESARPQEHIFGKNEGQKVMAHVARALKLHLNDGGEG